MRSGELEAKRWLRRLREDAELSQAALAEIVGVDRKTIINAESEQEGKGLPHGFTLLRILQELGVIASAPSSADRPLGRLEEKVDEALGGIADVLELLREPPSESDAGVPRESRP